MIKNLAINSAILSQNLKKINLISRPVFNFQLKYQSSSTYFNDNDYLNKLFILNDISNKLYSTKISPVNQDLAAKYKEFLKQEKVSGYILFVKENYKSISEQNKTSSGKEQIKLAAESWKKLTEEEKKKYLDTANKNKLETKTEINKLLSGLNEEELKNLQSNIKREESLKKEKKLKIKIKKEKNKLDAPKRPPGGFFLFCKSLDRGEAPVKQFVQAAAQKWRILAQQDKDKFNNESKALFEEYENKLKLWENKMIDDGKKKLVRKKSVPKVSKPKKMLKKKMSKKTRKSAKKLAKRVNKIEKKLQKETNQNKQDNLVLKEL